MANKKFITIFLFLSFFVVVYLIINNDKVHKVETKDILVNESSDEQLERKIFDEDKNSVSLSSQEEFTPQLNNLFLVSFYLRLDVDPKIERRQKLITHYEADKIPYPGWAVSIVKYPSNYRFEIYAKGKNSNGGWYTFESTKIKKNTFYAVSILFEAQSFISLYLIEVDEAKNINGPLIFLGSFSIDDIDDLSVNSNLLITSGKPKIGTFRGEVIDFTIVNLKSQVLSKSILSEITRGPFELMNLTSSNAIESKCVISFIENKNNFSCLYP